MTEKFERPDAAWREMLTTEQYRVTRGGGTERAFSHPLWQEKRKGGYHCVCCGRLLFEADAKYDSGSGWPSFWRPAEAASVSEHADRSWFAERTEIRCAHCDAHLGHVFPDGPQPTELRYCVNGTALDFRPDEAAFAPEAAEDAAGKKRP